MTTPPVTAEKPERPARLAVLISGGGTTLQNLLDRRAAGTFAAEVGLVIASRPDAGGLARAARAGVPALVIEPRPRDDFSARVFAAIRAADIDLVILAGWLHLLEIPDDFRLRVLNVHPSLLPAFGGHGMYGPHVHEAAFAAGVKVSGCTVHFADDDYDTGPIIAQRAVSVADCQTPAAIAARVFAAECEAYPAAIEQILGGVWRVEGRGVVWG